MLNCSRRYRKAKKTKCAMIEKAMRNAPRCAGEDLCLLRLRRIRVPWLAMVMLISPSDKPTELLLMCVIVSLKQIVKLEREFSAFMLTIFR